MAVGVETVVGVEVRTMVKVTGMRPEKGVEAKVVKEALAVVKEALAVVKEALAVVRALEMMGPSWVGELTVEVNEMTPLEVTHVAQVEVEKMMMLLPEVVLVRMLFVRKLPAEVVLVMKLSAEAVFERIAPAQVEMLVKDSTGTR